MRHLGQAMATAPALPLLVALALCLTPLIPAQAAAEPGMYEALATHIGPAVDDLMSLDASRVEAARHLLDTQDVKSIATDLRIDPERAFVSATARVSVLSRMPHVTFRLGQDLTVLSVTHDGSPVRFTRDEGGLTVRSEMLADGVSDIEIVYEGRVNAGPSVTHHGSLLILGADANWYPAPEYGDRCVFRTTVRYPEGNTSVCTGALEGMTPLPTDPESAYAMGDVWDTRVPVASAAVAVGPLASTYSVWGDVFLGYHMFVRPDEEPPEEMEVFLTELKETVRYLESYYGPYPFEWLNVLFVPGVSSALRPVGTAPGLVIISAMYWPGGGFEQPRQDRVASGLSKSWWPASTDAGIIVSEGLSGHVEVSYLEDTEREDSAVNRRDYARKRYISAMADSGGRAPLTDCLKAGRSIDARVCATRSQAFMGILEAVVGRNAFRSTLTKVGRRHEGDMVSLAEFMDEFEAEESRDLDWLVYEWLCRGDLPAYVLTYDVTRKGDGHLIRGTIAQRGEIFRTPVPVTIDLGVWSYEEWVPVRSSEQSFEVLAELEPQAVTIDARYVVPRIEADELALVHFTSGAKAAEANEWGTAVDEFGAASELAPGNSEYAFRYGEALVHSGRLELGLAALEGAVEAAPDNADAGMELARLYLVSGRSAKALPHLERYVALRADDPAGHTARAMALIACGRLAAAERSLDAAASLVDSVDVNDETLELLRLATGRYHEATGDTSSAAAAYREALKVNPVSDEARRALARLHED